MKLGLVKIEEGICRGNVVHHEFIKRTPAEIKKQLDGVKNKRELKEKRKREQEENVRKKAEKKGEITSVDKDYAYEKDGDADGGDNEGDDFKDEG
jgi:ribosome biogenesis protein SSF1/2